MRGSKRKPAPTFLWSRKGDVDFWAAPPQPALAPVLEADGTSHGQSEEAESTAAAGASWPSPRVSGGTPPREDKDEALKDEPDKDKDKADQEKIVEKDEDTKKEREQACSIHCPFN